MSPFGIDVLDVLSIEVFFLKNNFDHWSFEKKLWKSKRDLKQEPFQAFEAHHSFDSVISHIKNAKTLHIKYM